MFLVLGESLEDVSLKPSFQIGNLGPDSLQDLRFLVNDKAGIKTQNF